MTRAVLGRVQGCVHQVCSALEVLKDRAALRGIQHPEDAGRRAGSPAGGLGLHAHIAGQHRPLRRKLDSGRREAKHTRAQGTATPVTGADPGTTQLRRRSFTTGSSGRPSGQEPATSAGAAGQSLVWKIPARLRSN